MNQVLTVKQMGNIIRRVREEKGISRATLASETGIGARTIYALEKGESVNFGLGNFLRILEALGLSLSVDFAGNDREKRNRTTHFEMPQWDTLSDVWKLDNKASS